MAVKNCASCGQPMNAVAAICPHCAKRQPGFDPTAARKAMSPDEIRALLLVDPSMRNTAPTSGLFSTLVLPHHATSGLARTIEIVLTIACAPLIIAGTIAIGLRRRVARERLQSAQGELMPVVVMTLFGALPLQFLLDILGCSGTQELYIIIGAIVALIARGILRARAASGQSADLMRIES
jgi:hypothetical protein